MQNKLRSWLFLTSIFLMIASGIIYELLIAAYSAYLQGDSIYQYSLTIGLFMSAMGVGSYLTHYIKDNPIDRLGLAQLTMALLGGYSVLLLGIVDLYTPSYRLFSHLWTFILGALIGVQLPLAMHIIENKFSIKKLIANVLFIDYVGALVGSLILPWYLMPHLGFAKTSLFAGYICLLAFSLLMIAFRKELHQKKKHLILFLIVGIFLFIGWKKNESFLSYLRQLKQPKAELAYLYRSPYQELRFMRYKKSYFLALNKQPQFSTQDEQRYHEVLIHPAMTLASSRQRVLILGGGDGLALREIWRYHDVKEVVMVDLDPAMTNFGKNNPTMKRFNHNSMQAQKRRYYCLYEWSCRHKKPQLLYSLQIPQQRSCPSYTRPLPHSNPHCRLHTRRTSTLQRLHIYNRDAWKYVEEGKSLFSVIISDLPDATNISLSKLYSVEFYKMLRRRLAPKGMIGIQSTSVSPYFRRGYWCIVNTVHEAGLITKGYQVWVPSYGLHTSFTLASKNKIDLKKLHLRVPTRFLNDLFFPALFWFPKDMNHIKTPINRIDTHILLQLLLHG